MKTRIYCETTAKGEHSFYLWANGEEYYLFRQDYRKGVQLYFHNGIRLDEAFDFSKTRGDNAVIHTLCKIPGHIKYIEREYGITLLKQTKKRNQRKKLPISIAA